MDCGLLHQKRVRKSAFHIPQSTIEMYVPQSIPNRRPLLMWLVAALGSVAVMLLIISAPLALESGHTFWGLTIYRAFSHVCHQIPERSFFIAGHPFAVCARCTGLYTGFAIAMVSYPLLRSLRQTEAPARKWLFLAALPLGIDFAVGYFGIWENTHFSRFATGALLGAVSVLYVVPGLSDLSLRFSRSVPSTSIVNTPTKNSFSTDAPAAPSDYSAPHRRI